MEETLQNELSSKETQPEIAKETPPETMKGVHPTALNSFSRLEKYLLAADELIKQKQVMADTKLHSYHLSLLTLTPAINCIAESDLIVEMEARHARFGTFRGPIHYKAFYYYHAKNEERLKYKWAKANLK